MYFKILSFFFHFHYIESASILGIFPFTSFSHQLVYQSLWRELSLRGHKITVITPNPLNDPLLHNLTEIDMKEAYELVKGNKVGNLCSRNANVFQSAVEMTYLEDAMVEVGLNITEFQELISNKNKTFDLILAECFFPVLHILSERYGAPIVSVSSATAFTPHYTLIGSPNHPVLYPDVNLNSPTEDLSYWQKVKNVVFGIWFVFYHFYFFAPRGNKIGEKYFGKNLSQLVNLEKNVSMLCVNENSFLRPVRPHVPAVVQMGQTHLKPAKSLPKDLQKVLDEAKEGVVYFSLGSNIKSIYIKENIIKIIIQTFSELPYTVIWKWESDYLPNKPPNVIIAKWLPQQDLLVHPNVRVFVTQGGLQSFEEAIDKEVPMVGLPFTYDQPTNMEKMAALGIGVTLDPTTLTKSKFKNAITEVAENNIYKNRIKKIRYLLLDKHVKGLDNAIWWFEYVIRHKGAKHLRTSSADISWFDYFMLDLLLIFVITLTCFTYGSCKLVNHFYSLVAVFQTRNLRNH